MAKSQRTTLESMLDLSIRLNGLLIPASAAEGALTRYTQPLIAINDDDTYPLSLAGSAVAVHYRDRYCLLCTRHQVLALAREPECFGLLTKDGRDSISSGGVRHFVGVNEIDYHDLVAFDFTEPCRARRDLKELFYNWTAVPPDTPSDHIVCLVLSGYPFGDQNYDLANGRRLGQLRRIIPCLLDGPEQPSDPSLLRVRPLEQLSFDPDGLSGGPAFVVQIINGVGHAFFAGIITRAGKSHIHIVRAGFVRHFMDAWIDLDQKQGKPND